MKAWRMLIVLGTCFGCTIDLAGPGGGGGSGGGGGNGGNGNPPPWTPPPCTAPTSFKLNRWRDTVDVGRAIVLTASGPNAAWCTTSWVAGDPAVAGVAPYGVVDPFATTQSGAVSGLASGTSLVTVKMGGLFDTARIAVVPPRSRFTAVAAGPGMRCALATDGHAWCWAGMPMAAAVPTRVPIDSELIAVSTGAERACGIARSGAAYCWGLLWYTVPSPYMSRELHAIPVPIGTTERFAAIAGGEWAGDCGILVDGTAVCWGENGNGQLGVGSGASLVAVPTPVVGGHVFTQITAGDDHFCGLTADGAAWCWGWSRLGQTGEGVAGETTTRPAPVVGGITFREVSAGYGFTCGLAADSTAWCWGRNDLGQLGTGDTAAMSATPHRVAGVSRMIAVDAGEGFACALRIEGTVYCWGGSLGPVPVVTSSPVAFTSFSVAGSTVCAIGIDRKAYCWDAGSAPGLVPGQPG